MGLGMLYFYVLDARELSERVAPALGQSWQRRSFAPCLGICRELAQAIRRFQERFHVLPEDMLLTQVGRGLSFERGTWRALAGEVLLVSAKGIPELETAVHKRHERARRLWTAVPVRGCAR